MASFSCTACETVNGTFVCHACEPEKKKSFFEEIGARIFHSLIVFFIAFTYYFRVRTFWDRMNDKARFRFDFIDFIVLAVGFDMACMQFWSAAVDDSDKKAQVADAVKEVVAKVSNENHVTIADSSHLSSIYGIVYDVSHQFVQSGLMTILLFLAALPMAFPFFFLFNRNKAASFISYLSCLGIFNTMFGCLDTLFRTFAEALLWFEYPNSGPHVKLLILYPEAVFLLIFLISLTRLNKYAFKINYIWAFVSAVICIAVQIGIGIALYLKWPGLF